MQKKKIIDKNLADKLKKKNFVEGRYPNLFIAAELAISEEDKVSYIKNKSFDDKYFKDLLMSLFKRYDTVKKDAVDKLLEGKLSEVLSEKQKSNKIKNLLKALSIEGKIICTKRGAKSEWKIKRSND